MKKVLGMFALLALASLVAFGADVNGKWVGEGGGKRGPVTFNFKADGMKLSGNQEGQNGPTEITDGKIDGDSVSFIIIRDMGDKGKVVTKYKGTVSGDTMKLNAETEGRGPREVVLKKSGT